MPATGALIVNPSGQLLLVRRGIQPKKGWWDVAGGFLEPGEHPTMGLRRELREELGIRPPVVDFFGMYTDTYHHQSIVHTLNIVYRVRLKQIKLRPMSDVAGVRWFNYRDIPWSRLAFPWLKPCLREYGRTI